MNEFFISLDQLAVQPPHKIPTGLTDLDQLLLGGITQPALTVISGFPGVGKTDLALNIAHSAACTDAKVGIISLESPTSVLAQRLKKSLTPNSANIALNFSPQLDLSQLEQAVTDQKTQNNLDLLIVDPIEMIGPTTALQTYAKRLKQLAHGLDLSIVAVTSTLPEVKYLHKSPLFAIADIVIQIVRDDLRYTQAEWERKFPTKSHPRGLAQIHVTKNRTGQTGSITTLYSEQSGKYTSLTIK